MSGTPIEVVPPGQVVNKRMYILQMHFAFHKLHVSSLERQHKEWWALAPSPLKWDRSLPARHTEATCGGSERGLHSTLHSHSLAPFWVPPQTMDALLSFLNCLIINWSFPSRESRGAFKIEAHNLWAVPSDRWEESLTGFKSKALPKSSENSFYWRTTQLGKHCADQDIFVILPHGLICIWTKPIDLMSSFVNNKNEIAYVTFSSMLWKLCSLLRRHWNFLILVWILHWTPVFHFGLVNFSG